MKYYNEIKQLTSKTSFHFYLIIKLYYRLF